MNADGSNQHPLHHEDNRYSDGAYSAWSPDGTAIAFTANNGTGYYHVWSVPAAGGQNTKVNKRKHIVRFGFAATGPATGYRCALRARKRRVHFGKCSSPKTYKHLKAGRYTFEVKAFGPGEPYRAVARRKFKIPHRHHHR